MEWTQQTTYKNFAIWPLVGFAAYALFVPVNLDAEPSAISILIVCAGLALGDVCSIKCAVKAHSTLSKIAFSVLAFVYISATILAIVRNIQMIIE